MKPSEFSLLNDIYKILGLISCLKNWKKYPNHVTWLTKQQIILNMIQNRLATSTK